MLGLIFIPLIIIFIVFMARNKIVLRIDTLFRKGFTKQADKYGIYCFCGKQGDGKTYSICDVIEELLKNGYKVISNVESFVKSHNNCIYEANFQTIHEMYKTGELDNNTIIFYDEIFTLIEKGRLSQEVLSFLSQLRKRGIYLYTTCQEWLELNITFRRYVRYQVECNMINLPLFRCAISINTIKDAYQMKWDNNENEYVCPIIKTTIKKCSIDIANRYDTFEVIKTQGKLLARSNATR